MRTAPVVLVVARAPVPGQAKTRLAASIGDEGAAELAAASLLDTLDAAAGAAELLGSGPAVVALTGEPAAGARASEVQAALRGCRVIPQRGLGLAARLAAAHLDAARAAHPARGAHSPVVQVGMDTPQAGADLLVACAHQLEASEAVLGPAEDGGWWLLGVRRAGSARVLRTVEMSTPDTGLATRAALHEGGCDVAAAPVLRDVDTIADARAVAAIAAHTRFAAAALSLLVSS